MLFSHPGVCVCWSEGDKHTAVGKAWPGPGTVPRCPHCLPARPDSGPSTGGGAGAVPGPWCACPRITWEGENGSLGVAPQKQVIQAWGGPGDSHVCQVPGEFSGRWGSCVWVPWWQQAADGVARTDSGLQARLSSPCRRAAVRIDWESECRGRQGADRRLNLNPVSCSSLPAQSSGHVSDTHCPTS